MRFSLPSIIIVRWPTTVTAKPKTSRQKQKHHGKTNNLTAKTKYLTAKPKTSRQNQIPHSKNKIGLVLPWVFPFAVRYLVFAVKYLDLSWGLLFCPEVFCFCREVFGFAVRFLVLPWQLWATVFMKLKLKIFWLKECRVFCIEKYNSAPSYLRHSRKLAK